MMSTRTRDLYLFILVGFISNTRGAIQARGSMVASEEGTSDKNVFGLLNEQFVKLEQTFVEQQHTIKQLKTLMMTKEAENYFLASSTGGSRVIACERQSLEMSYQADEQIDVVQAAYGRLNNEICPYNWKLESLMLNSSPLLHSAWQTTASGLFRTGLMFSKSGCQDVVSGAMAKRGAWLRQKMLCLGIPATGLKSTLKSGTPANPKIWSKMRWN